MKIHLMMKIFPEIEMQNIVMPETGSPAIAIRTKVRAERDPFMYEEEFKGIYPQPSTPSEYAEVVSHFMLECYAWQTNHIFTTETIAENQEPENQRVWDIFSQSFKHKREDKS